VEKYRFLGLEEPTPRKKSLSLSFVVGGFKLFSENLPVFLWYFAWFAFGTILIPLITGDWSGWFVIKLMKVISHGKIG